MTYRSEFPEEMSTTEDLTPPDLAVVGYMVSATEDRTLADLLDEVRHGKAGWSAPDNWYELAGRAADAITSKDAQLRTLQREVDRQGGAIAAAVQLDRIKAAAITSKDTEIAQLRETLKFYSANQDFGVLARQALTQPTGGE
jgi:hypothetical protein